MFLVASLTDGYDGDADCLQKVEKSRTYFFYHLCFVLTIYILKSEASVCATVRRYFLVPCDKHKHTGHAQQQAASQASTDFPLADTLCGYRTVVSVSSAVVATTTNPISQRKCA